MGGCDWRLPPHPAFLSCRADRSPVCFGLGVAVRLRAVVAVVVVGSVVLSALPASAGPSRWNISGAPTGYTTGAFDGDVGYGKPVGQCSISFELEYADGPINGEKVSCVGVIPASNTLTGYAHQVPVDMRYGVQTSGVSTFVAYSGACSVGSYWTYSGYTATCDTSGLGASSYSHIVAQSVGTVDAYTAAFGSHSGVVWRSFRLRYEYHSTTLPAFHGDSASWCGDRGGVGGTDSAISPTYSSLQPGEFISGGFVNTDGADGWFYSGILAPHSITCEVVGSTSAFPDYPPDVAPHTPDDGPAPCSIGSLYTSLPFDSLTTGAPVFVSVGYRGSHDFTTFSATSLSDPVGVSSTSSVVAATLHPRAGYHWTFHISCTSDGTVYDLGDAATVTIPPGSGGDGAGGPSSGGSFDFADCISGATDALDLLSPGTWVNYALTGAKCSAEWLFIPDDSTLRNTLNQFGVTSSPSCSSAAAASQIFGCLARAVVLTPYTAMGDLRTGAYSSSDVCAANGLVTRVVTATVNPCTLGNGLATATYRKADGTVTPLSVPLGLVRSIVSGVLYFFAAVAVYRLIRSTMANRGAPTASGGSDD